jgi:hypothetical protein
MLPILVTLAVALGTAADAKPVPKADAWGAVRKLGTADGLLFAISPDGNEIVIHPYARAMSVLDLRTAKVRRIPGAFGSHLGSVAYSPDGKLLACAEWQNGATIRDAKTWEVLHRFTPSGGHPVSTAAFTPDGKRVAFYCWYYRGGFHADDRTKEVTHHDYQLVLWDVAAKKELGWPAASRVDFPGVHFHESTFRDRPLLFIREDRSDEKGYAKSKTFSMTDITTNKTTPRIDLHKDDDRVFDVTPDARQILVMTAGKDPRLVEVATGKSGRSFGGHQRLVTAAALSRDGKRVVTASGRQVDGFTAAKLPAWPPDVGPTELRIHDAATGDVIAAYQDDALFDFTYVGFSPDGKYVWGQTSDYQLMLWGRFPAMPEGAKVNWPVDPKPEPFGGIGGVARPPRADPPADLPLSDSLDKLVESLPKSGRTVEQQIDAVFLAALGRFPTVAEQKAVAPLLGAKPTAERWKGVLGRLVQAPEFEAHVKTLQNRLPPAAPRWDGGWPNRPFGPGTNLLPPGGFPSGFPGGGPTPKKP